MTGTEAAAASFPAALHVRTRSLTMIRDAGLPPGAGTAVRFLEGNLPPFLRPGDGELFLACTAGFHLPPEPGGAWMGPEVTLLFGYDPAAAALAVDLWVPPMLLRGGSAAVQLRLDGIELGRAAVREGDLRIEANLPPAIRGLPPGAPLPLRLSWERWFRPCDTGDSPDVRRLTAVLRGAGQVDGTGYPLPPPPPPPRADLPVAVPALHGTCTVCGVSGRFLAAPGIPASDNLPCPGCRSFARWRMLARGLLLFLAGRGWSATSVASLRDSPPGTPVRILDTCSSWPPARLLRGVPGIETIVSEYDPGVPPGEEVAPGVRCENLERLTLPPASVDAVLTGDVLEHIRLYRRALAEIFRVLRPGGEFLFTVPCTGEGRATGGHEIFREVVDPGDPSRDRDLREPVFHEDTRSGGSLVYRLYSRDLLLDELRELGFLVAYERRTLPGLALPDQQLFRALKPGEPSPGERT